MLEGLCNILPSAAIYVSQSNLFKRSSIVIVIGGGSTAAPFAYIFVRCDFCSKKMSTC
jgi:hypothetical protein